MIPPPEQNLSWVSSENNEVLTLTDLHCVKSLQYERYSLTKVDNLIATDTEYIGGSEDDLIDRSSSRFDMSCKRFDHGSISQRSLTDSAVNIFKSSFVNYKSISSGNIPCLSPFNIPCLSPFKLLPSSPPVPAQLG